MKVCPVCHNREVADAQFCSECGFHFIDGDNISDTLEHKKPQNSGFSQAGSLEGGGIDGSRPKPRPPKDKPTVEPGFHKPDTGSSKDQEFKEQEFYKTKDSVKEEGFYSSDSEPPKSQGLYTGYDASNGMGYGSEDYHERKRKKSDLNWKGKKGDPEDRPRRPVWPFIAGFIALAIIVGTGIFFTISNNNLIKSQEKEIEDLYRGIGKLRDHQKENYLDEALENYKGDQFCDEAKEKKEADIKNEQKISYLKTIKEDFEEYDDKLAANQKESLDKEFKKVKGKYKEPYLIDGEKEQFDSWEKEYDDNIEGRRFKAARQNIEDYGNREKMIANDDEISSNYSVKHLLDENEFMPETLDFSASADTYTNNGSAMGADHFTLIEQIGEKGKETYIDIDDVSMEMDGNMAKYVLKFKPGKKDDYTSKRAYVLHVRNQKADKAFTAMEGTVPEVKIQQATADYMKAFVKAFNADCSAESKTFDKMKEYLEDGSQAYDDYKGLPGKDNVEGEGIYDQDDFRVSVNKDHSKVKVDVTFYYEIARYRTYKDIKENSTEKSFARSDSTKSKDFIIYDSFVAFERDGENMAQNLDDSSRFLVHEYLSESNHFEINMTNSSIGRITDHDNGSANVTRVEEMSYQVDDEKEIYNESDYGDDDGNYNDNNVDNNDSNADGDYNDGNEDDIDQGEELYDDDF